MPDEGVPAVTDYFHSAAPTGPAPDGPAQPAWGQQPATPTWGQQPSAPTWGQPAAPTWGQPAWGAAVPAKRSTAATVAIVVGCVVGGLVVLGILAAIAIPVFLNQRAKAEAAHISVSIPESVGSLTRLHDAHSAALEQRLLSIGTPGKHYAAVYGTGSTPSATVSISTHVMTASDRSGFLDGAKRGAIGSPGASSLTFSDVNAGALGGQMQCAALPAQGSTICFFVDAGSYGFVTVAKPLGPGAAFARTMRAAVEHRR